MQEEEGALKSGPQSTGEQRLANGLSDTSPAEEAKSETTERENESASHSESNDPARQKESATSPNELQPAPENSGVLGNNISGSLIEVESACCLQCLTTHR